MQALDQILALTETVEQHVERGEWLQAGALDAERCRLLAELFARPGATTDLAAYRDVLQELVMRNRQTIQRVQERKRELEATAALAGRSGNAMQAYGRNAAPANLVYLREPQVTEP
jgi:hypothetical protein